jgi:hypothetical protein
MSKNLGKYRMFYYSNLVLFDVHVHSVLDHQEKATVTSLKPKIVKVSDNVGNG